jgi:hypothetical protein
MTDTRTKGACPNCREIFAALTQERDAAREELRDVASLMEWTYDGSARLYCSACGRYKEDGHKDDCWIRAALASAPQEKCGNVFRSHQDSNETLRCGLPEGHGSIHAPAGHGKTAGVNLAGADPASPGAVDAAGAEPAPVDAEQKKASQP